MFSIEAFFAAEVTPPLPDVHDYYLEDKVFYGQNSVGETTLVIPLEGVYYLKIDPALTGDSEDVTELIQELKENGENP